MTNPDRYSRPSKRRPQSWLIAGCVRDRRMISRRSEIGRLVRGIDACLELYAYPDRERGLIKMCVTEALVNAIKHGNGEDADAEVRVDCRIDEECFWIRVEDDGAGFQVQDIPDPRLPDNIERETGRGVFLMRTYMDDVHYNTRGNIVELRKYRPAMTCFN